LVDLVLLIGPARPGDRADHEPNDRRQHWPPVRPSGRTHCPVLLNNDAESAFTEYPRPETSVVQMNPRNVESFSNH
jgi:hypothetical protein